MGEGARILKTTTTELVVSEPDSCLIADISQGNMAVFTWQTVSAVLIVAVFSAADDSCVKTLEDGDTNQDGILSEQEFVTFLKAEAMKGKRNSAVELRCENTETQKEINHLFATFATEGQNGISIRETEITDDRDAVPAQEKAVLELLCERTKSFLADQSTLGATKEANIKPEDAMNTCPDQFQTAVACAISSCSTFVDVCHSIGGKRWHCLMPAHPNQNQILTQTFPHFFSSARPY